uniref:Transposase n=1 Tax=Eriphia verrucosa TaxID=483417 RepID=B3CK13_ERIVE|nr:transposase [Eriphia verrucosa]
MEKVEHRAVMKFLTKEGNNAKEIYECMVAVYTDTAPSYATVARWNKEFRHGRESLEDDPRPGRPSDVTTDDNVARVKRMILENRRVKVEEIERELGISYGSVCNIIHENLAMTKVSARWVPRNLTPHDRLQCRQSSEELLLLYNQDPEEFESRIVTGDDTWVHHWDPETKLESMAWKHKGSPTPIKFRAQPSARKIMATTFWDCKGVLMLDYAPRGRTITGQYYAEELARLKECIRQKRRGKLSHGVLLLHDNAPVHKARVAQVALCECEFEKLNHPPYSPDLAPGDYFLFRHLKAALRGRRFEDDEDVQHAVQEWIEQQSGDFWLSGIRSLRDKWHKCIEVEGGYIEK